MPVLRLLAALCLNAVCLAAFCLLVVAPGQALGQSGVGVSPEGRKGTVHVVEKGDTLWDIASRYLGTPWIWPAIWKENTGIENPHLIYPGDLIWITVGEMRKLSQEEAEAFLADREVPPTPPSEPERDALPEEPAPEPTDPFAVLDGGSIVAQRNFIYQGLAQAPYVTADEFDAAGAVLGSHADYFWLSQEQAMIVNLGEGEVRVGDLFSIYRIRRPVMHPKTGETVGYFVEVLGRAEITEVLPETSNARIALSYAEIEPGDRLRPLEPTLEEFALEPLDGDVEGIILAQQPYRIYSGEGDVVVLDRGAEHGLSIGNELVVYRAGELVRDPLSDARLLEPDDILGRLFVLRIAERSSVALITRARSEIEPGDRFRNP